MTLRELLGTLGADASLWAPVLGLPPLMALVIGFLHGRGSGNSSPWQYIYSFCVYAACLPGMLATVLTIYAVGFARENLLDLNATVYLLPIGTMVATLILVGRGADFDTLPGFGRLAGLMTMIAAMFVIVLAIEKTRILLVFWSSIWTLIGFAAFVFALIKWGAYMAFRQRGAPEKPAPKLPGVMDGD